MDKQKKILAAIGTQISNSKLIEAVTSDDWDSITDEDIDSIVTQTKGLLTKEAAVNNPEIIEAINKENYPLHMKTALSKVEGKLKPIYDKVGIDYSDAEFLSDKIEDLNEAIDKASTQGESKEVIESLNRELREAKESLIKKEQEGEQKLNELREQVKRDKIYSIYKAKATEKPWADVYSDPDLKELALEKTWKKLTAKAHLDLDESGEVLVRNKEMPDKFIYLEGNKQATFQSLLEPEIDGYIKKSTPATQQPTTQPPTQAVEMPNTKASRMARQKDEYARRSN